MNNRSLAAGGLGSARVRAGVRVVMVWASTLCFVAAESTVGAGKQGSCEQESLSTFQAQLQARIDAHPGVACVMLKHLETGDIFEFDADRPMPTASLIKFPVMIEAYRQSDTGEIDLAKRLTLRAEDKVPGSGILTPHFSPGATITLRDAIHLMIVFSDNTATNLVIDQIGLSTTADTMNAWGWSNTKLHSKVFRRDTSIDPLRSKEFGLGSTTARDMIEMLERLHRRQLVSQTSSEAMLDHLMQCDDRSTFPARLPKNTRVAHKTGMVTGVRSDAGLLLRPGSSIAICVLTKDNRRIDGSDDDPGESLCADIARMAFDQFAASNAAPSAGAAVGRGASGEAVRRIQEVLNQRVVPSPGLDLDGEFGPLTEAAVKHFQRAQGLEVSGLVDATTEEALFKKP